MREYGGVGERGRGCRTGINRRTTGEERRGECRTLAPGCGHGFVPVGCRAADDRHPGQDGDRPGEELAGKTWRCERCVGGRIGMPAVGVLRRLSRRGVVRLVPGMATVGVTTGSWLRRAGGRQSIRRSRGDGGGSCMLPPAAAAVVVGGRGQKAGRQMHDQTEHRGESATDIVGLIHRVRLANRRYGRVYKLNATPLQVMTGTAACQAESAAKPGPRNAAPVPDFCSSVPDCFMALSRALGPQAGGRLGGRPMAGNLPA